MFYTYAHYKPDHSVFYIGKGHGRRAWSNKNRNPHWHHITAKYENHKVEILAKWPTEQEALEHEKFLIWCFRDMGCLMANIADGGKGISGYKHTEKTRKILSEHHKKLHNLPEQKIKNSARNKLRMQDPDIKARVRAGALKYMSVQENRDKSRIAALLQNSSLEFRQKQRERAFARMQQPKYRLLMSKACICVETGQIFESQADAARWIGKNAKSQTINRAVSGTRKTAYGYHWQNAIKE